MLPQRHGGGEDVVQQPLNLIEKAVEFLLVVERPKSDRSELIVGVVREGHEAEQLVAVA
jgi:hypothetical protein